MDEAVNATQVNECTEVNNAGDHTIANLSALELIQEGLTDLTLGLLEVGTARKNYVVPVLVQFNNLGFKDFTDVWLQVADATHFHQ